jgi:hypothetical protein
MFVVPGPWRTEKCAQLEAACSTLYRYGAIIQLRPVSLAIIFFKTFIGQGLESDAANLPATNKNPLLHARTALTP